MKKAKNAVLYLVCAGTILFLLVCAGAMGHSIMVQTGDAFRQAMEILYRAQAWFRILLCVAVVSWLVLCYLEKPIHRRDLSGYALILLVATAMWFAFRIWGHYNDRLFNVEYNPVPWHFAVFIDTLLFSPFLILEIVAFFFLCYRGRLNYPEEYRKKPEKPKREPRKIRIWVVVFLVTVILLSLLTFWCYTAFRYRDSLSVAVFGYDVSDDGSYMLLAASAMTSMYNFNEYECVQYGNALCLRFYYNYSPIYRHLKEPIPYPLRLELPPGCTEIYVFDPQFCSDELILKLDEETGNWLIRRYNVETEEYYYIYDEAPSGILKSQPNGLAFLLTGSNPRHRIS